MKNKVTCVCDLCSMGIPQSKQCYIGVRNCLKNGVYVEFRNREEEFKDKALDKACKELETLNMTFNNANYNDVKNSFEWKEWCENE